MKINHLIQREFITTEPFVSIDEIKEKLVHHEAIVVKDEVDFYGVLTANDIVTKKKALAVNNLKTNITIEINSTVEEVLALMNEWKISVLAVKNFNKIVGLIFKKDIHTYLSNIKFEVSERVHDYSKSYLGSKLIISSISHDLRRPACNIIKLIELLKEGKLDIPCFQEQLVIVLEQTKKASILIDNLLEWSIKNSKRKHHFQEFNLIALSLDVIQFLKSTANLKNIEIFFHSEVNNYILSTDVYIFGILLRNIIENAIQFSPIGGKINVEFKLINQKCVFSITDNGVGIAREKLVILNQPKPIGYNSKMIKDGIGLLICHKILEFLGGSLWIESKLNEGTTISFSLPVPSSAA